MFLHCQFCFQLKKVCLCLPICLILSFRIPFDLLSTYFVVDKPCFASSCKGDLVFFLGRVSLWTTADPYSNPYAFPLLLFAGASHHQSYCRCATQRSTLKLSAALPSRKAHLFPPKGEPPFCHSVCEMAPLNPPSDADFVFSDIRGDHSAPVIWAGFHRRYVRWRHMTLQKETTTTGLESFSFSLRPVYGRFFNPGFPSCGRAGPGVEPGTFKLEIRCSTTEPFRPPQRRPV